MAVLKILAACALASTLWAESVALNIPRVTRAPKLRDFLSNTPREAELAITDFRQYEPGDGTPVSQPTAAYLSYDDRNLYIAFICQDNPRLIRARLAKREQIMRDDRITISLDTFHDHRRAYWFDVNPYGVQADGNVTDGVEDDLSWDALWYSEAKITESGYAVLAAIPFKSIRFPKTSPQTWGLVLGRFIQRNNELSCWPYLSHNRPGWVQQGGDVAGMRDISPGHNFQFIPYGLFSGAHFLDQPPGENPAMKTRAEARAGLDAKMVVHDSFTLDLTVNPDFSQVESDEPQVTMNQRYEVFFPEKRPFFLENAGMFKTPETLLFSRRILDPAIGIRFTGKHGRWALAVMGVDDRGPGKQQSAGGPLFEHQTGIGVFRLQREFLRDSIAGILMTTRNFGPYWNRVAAIDTQFRIIRNWIVVGQATTSETRMPNGQRLSGPAYLGSVERVGRHFSSKFTYTDRSPQFRADLGYIQRVDIREAKHFVEYRWRTEKRMLISFGPGMNSQVNYNREGRLQDWLLNPQFVFELPRLTKISLDRIQAFELYRGLGFRKMRNQAAIDTEWLKWLAVSSSYSRGYGINYYPAAGLAPFLGSAVDAKIQMTIRPGLRTRFEESYLYSTLRAPERWLPLGAGPSATVFNNHIFRSKVNHQFSRALSVRAIADYNAVLSNESLVSADRTKHIGLDLLLTYMLHPGTALHIGYTDLYDNIWLEPAISPVLKRTAFPDLSTGRQFFIKLSYLIRL